jgi:hypothetical protein
MVRHWHDTGGNYYVLHESGRVTYVNQVTLRRLIQGGRR